MPLLHAMRAKRVLTSDCALALLFTLGLGRILTAACSLQLASSSVTVGGRRARNV